LLRRSQDKLKQIMPGGRPPGGAMTALLVLAAVALWGLSGFYTVKPDEIGINQVFGKYVGRTAPGLNWNWPSPIGHVVKPRVTAVNAIEIGARVEETRRGPRMVTNESLMLTGGENIVDIDFTVFWMIQADRPQDFVFNLARPEGTIRAVAESAMREVIGRSALEPIISRGRGQIQIEVAQLMQRILDSYGAGIVIDGVQISEANPPKEVVDAFRDVNNASQFAESLANQARGQAAQVRQAALGYKAQVVREAAGEAARFNQVYEQYRLAPGVTRDRLYIETMERVLGKTNKVIVDSKGASAPLILPPDVFRPKAAPQSSTTVPATPARAQGGAQ